MNSSQRYRRIAMIIGSLVAFIFVVIGGLNLDGILRLLIPVLGFIALIGALVITSVTRSEPLNISAPPHPHATTIFRTSAVTLTVLIIVGCTLLDHVDLGYLAGLWVGFVLGVHLLPLGRTFRIPTFTVVGITMIVIAAAGLVFALAASPQTTPWFQVLEGAAIFACGPGLRFLRYRHRTTPTGDDHAVTE